MEFIASILNKLTSQSKDENFSQLIGEFASSTGWNPSYYLEASTETFSNGHLVVEHGLENAAVLTFLKKPYKYLTHEEERTLLNISYNNLVDWHIPIDESRISFVYNRAKYENRVVESYDFYQDFDSLRVEAFEKVIGKKPSLNTPALDQVLSETISGWKRKLSVALNNNVSEQSLSTLFNSIIFIRAIEDNLRRKRKGDIQAPILLKIYNDDNNQSIQEFFFKCINVLGDVNFSSNIIDFEQLDVFNKIDRSDIIRLFRDFYINSADNFYTYDFSIMSKHALSRIYERYVSILKVKEEIQLSFYPKTPEEKINKSFGAYYTPQYIARFFVKFIQKDFLSSKFNDIKILEPAVGSGIFLRTLLEEQIETLLNKKASFANISNLFNNMTAIDKDQNACQATKLSIALLYLLMFDKFPNNLNVFNEEAVEFYTNNRSLKNSFDVIISNPPFIRNEEQNEGQRLVIKNFMDTLASGKIDQYLPFLRIAVESLKINGLALFIVPHTFLINKSASKVREYIHRNANVRLIADLSSIPVFGTVGTYVSLLIFQKKTENTYEPQNALILKCKSKNIVGKALEDSLKNIEIAKPGYSIYKVPQSAFSNDEWFVLSYDEYQIEKKFLNFRPIQDFLDINQGIATGNDDVLIVDEKNIPKGEKEIYKPLLQDRLISTFYVPKQSKSNVFYPFRNNIQLTEVELKKEFPETWKYLQKNKESLISRKSIKKEWWMLSSAKAPSKILMPKIVTPELTIVPKFGLDVTGKYIVSHSPFMKLKDNNDDIDLLYYFLGILNSAPCYWYIATHSNKYNSNYNKINPKTLKLTPVPDPNSIDRKDIISMVKLVKKRLEANEESAITLEKQIDDLAFKLYNLSSDDINILLGRNELS